RGRYAVEAFAARSSGAVVALAGLARDVAEELAGVRVVDADVVAVEGDEQCAADVLAADVDDGVEGAELAAGADLGGLAGLGSLFGAVVALPSGELDGPDQYGLVGLEQLDVVVGDDGDQ